MKLQKDEITIALAGNPNSGKTTLFNRLTGASARVGNWPGVTVEKKEGALKGGQKLIDLPGIYSLLGGSPEEVIARDYLTKQKPGAIINIVDALNIERNLYLTTQLLELGIPVVVALNMSDLLQKNSIKIDAGELSKELGVPCVKISAMTGEGCDKAVAEAVSAARKGVSPQTPKIFDESTQNAIDSIMRLTNTDFSQALALFCRDTDASGKLYVTQAQKDSIDAIIAQREAQADDSAASVIASERYNFIRSVTSKAVSRINTGKKPVSDIIDGIVTNRILALPIFACVMFLIYFLSIQTVGAFLTDWVNDSLFGEIIPVWAQNALESAGTAPWLASLLLDGIIAGVGAVLGFLPQMFILFLCLSLLEDCGYMARVAFIMDRVFKRFGLSGKSFIPLLISTGCGVPAIMSSRTIDSEKDKRLTVITTTFIPCSAKLPVIALIAGAVFSDSAWVAPSMYFIGITSVLVSGVILKKTKLFAADNTPFIMELPSYHAPKATGILKISLSRTWAFVKKAGTIILLSCVGVWFLASFNTSFEQTDISSSMLAGIGAAIAPVFAPLGWGNWQAAVATVTGLIAKENVVGTFGVILGFAEVAENGLEIWANIAEIFAPAAAFSFLLFNLMSAPCFAAIGAAHRELGAAKWTLFSVAYQCLYAYCVAFMFYQFAILIGGAAFSAGTLAAFAVLALFIWLLFRRPSNQTVTELKRRPSHG